MPRTAAELRAAAVATGYLDGPTLHYIGDGYTVPWQVWVPGSPLIGLTLWTYKAYLDALALEPSRLHDWLYTPYGKLINVTRLEADNALLEELGAISPHDGVIVFAAVRLGGEQYFGTSQTGYVPILPDPSTPNMPAASSTLIRSSTMPIKCVMVMQLVTKAGTSQPSVGYVSRSHIAGWTESWWANTDSLSEASGMVLGPRAGLDPLALARAGMLPTSASVIGCRFYAGGAGKGVFQSKQYPGTNYSTDLPSVALLCRTNNPGAPTVRRFTLRGIPDKVMEQGEYSPDAFFRNTVDVFMASLAGFGYYGWQYANVRDIFSISGTGLVTLKLASPFAVGNLVSISGAIDTGGDKHGGTFRVTAIGPGNDQFTIGGWPNFDTTKGTVSQKSRQFNAAIEAGQIPSVVRAVTRKVGRPFEQYVGRHSKKRRSA